MTRAATGRLRRSLLIPLLALATALAAGGAATPPAAAAAPLSLTARSAILVEPQTGDVVYQRAATKRREIASTTKLMTALLTLKSAAPSDVLTVPPYHPGPAESVIGLAAGERLTVGDLLRALMLPSANDAAETLAVGIAGSRAAFVRRMNQRARALGLRDTHYTTPIGLDDPGNYSSAADLVKLAMIDRTLPLFRHIVRLKSARLRSGAHPRTAINRNTLVQRIPWVDGVKTGHTTQAGYVLVASARRNGITLVSAVLGTPSEAARDADTLRLLRYGFHRYGRHVALQRGRLLARTKIRYRSAHADLVASRSIVRVSRNGERFALAVTAPDVLHGPIHRGDRLGTVTVRQRGQVVARVPLVAAHDVAAASLTERMSDYFGRSRTLILVVALVLCSLGLVLLRTVARRSAKRKGNGAEAEVA